MCSPQPERDQLLLYYRAIIGHSELAELVSSVEIEDGKNGLQLVLVFRYAPTTEDIEDADVTVTELYASFPSLQHIDLAIIHGDKVWQVPDCLND